MKPGLYPSITVMVDAIYTLSQERNNHSENCIIVKVSRITQNVDIYFEKEGYGLAFLIIDLGHNFSSNVGNEVGVIMRAKRPHKPEPAYDIVCIHSFMIHTDLIEYNIVGDTKTQFLFCCVAFFLFQSSKLETLRLLESK